MTPPRATTQRGILPLPERVAQLETGLDREEDYGRDIGNRVIELETWRREIEKFKTTAEARDALLAKLQEEARWNALLSKLGISTGVGSALFAVWQLLHGG